MTGSPQDENFFEITLSQDGAAHMMRTYKMVKWLFGITIFLSGVFLVTGYLRLLFYRNFPADNDIFFKFESVVIPLYSLFLSAALLGQFYCFFRFTRLCKKSIDLRQADLFNYSFKWLLRCAIFSLAFLIVELTVGIYALFSIVHYLEKLNGP